MRMPRFTANTVTSRGVRGFRSDSPCRNGQSADTVKAAFIGCELGGSCPPGHFCCDCGMSPAPCLPDTPSGHVGCSIACNEFWARGG